MSFPYLRSQKDTIPSKDYNSIPVMSPDILTCPTPSWHLISAGLPIPSTCRQDTVEVKSPSSPLTIQTSKAFLSTVLPHFITGLAGTVI